MPIDVSILNRSLEICLWTIIDTYKAIKRPSRGVLVRFMSVAVFCFHSRTAICLHLLKTLGLLDLLLHQHRSRWIGLLSAWPHFLLAFCILRQLLRLCVYLSYQLLSVTCPTCLLVFSRRVEASLSVLRISARESERSNYRSYTSTFALLHMMTNIFFLIYA